MDNSVDQGRDDPADWSVERVVQEFCHADRPLWSGEARVLSIEERRLLEPTLKTNDIDGDALLTLTRDVLKDDLGIQSYGQRHRLIKIIETLRKHSPKFQSSSTNADSLARMTSADTYNTPLTSWSRGSITAQSPLYERDYITKSIERPPSLLSPPIKSSGSERAFPSVSNIDAYTSVVQRDGLQTSHQLAAASVRHETTFENQTQRVPHPSASILPIEPVPSAGIYGASEAAWSTSVPLQSSRSAERPPLVGNSPLDMLEAQVDRQMHDSRERSLTAPSNDATSMPRQSYAIKNGRKRIAPTLISTRETMIQPATSNFSNTGKSYLAREVQSLHDVFYSPGDDHDPYFDSTSANISTAQRISRSKAIRFFLRTERQYLPNSKITMRFPYLQRHIGTPKEGQYFTMFAPKVPPSIQCLGDWPNLARMQSKSAGASISVEPFDKHATVANIPPDSEFDYLLEKYPVQENDDGLPTYGDSGDENEFDEETWQEIENEQMEDRLAARTLSHEEVESAIDRAIAEIKQSWTETHLPKVQRKAYRTWIRAARRHIRLPEMKAATAWRDRCENRIAQIKTTILKDVWNKVADVKAQCQSVEESVHQYQEQNYLIQTLSQDNPPELPSNSQPIQQPKARPPLADDEELIESEAESSLGMDDSAFIVIDNLESGSVAPVDAMDMEWQPQMPQHVNNSLQDSTSEVESIPYDDGLPGAKSPHDHMDIIPTSVVDSEQPSSDTDLSVNPDRQELSDPLASFLSADEADVETDAEDRVISPKDKRAHSKLQRTSPKKSHQPQFSQSSRVSSLVDAELPIPNHYRKRAMSQGETIDLTMLSSSDREDDVGRAGADFEVRTPELNPFKFESPTAKSSSKAKQGTAHFRHTQSTGSVEESSTSSVSSSGRFQLKLEKLKNVKKILQLDWSIIQQNYDHCAALAKAVYSLDGPLCSKLKLYLVSSIQRDLKKQEQILTNGIIALHNKQDRILSVVSKDQDTAMLMTLLFLTYVCAKDLRDRDDVAQGDIDRAHGDRDAMIDTYFKALPALLETRLQIITDELHLQTPKKTSKKRAFEDFETAGSGMSDDPGVATTDDLESDSLMPDAPPSSHRKRKRHIPQSLITKAQLSSGQDRIDEENRQRAKMAEKYAAMEAESGIPVCPVNFTEPVVYLDEHIARRVKPHQLRGIQFMWREIITDTKHQGCLLAHTMGLGKTMQVISLLVTIAQCNQSSDPDIKKYIPRHLRQNQTIILCPPSLIDNWFEEILLWSPNDTILGQVCKIRGSKDFGPVEKWAKEGGVLLMSYDLFRSLVTPPKKKHLDDDVRRKLEHYLLKTPTLVVADEAHKLKNPKSKIHTATARIQTQSRIALTGSPLNNHLEEYHTMINWIARNYLGDLSEFKQYYSEPITDGLYSESSALERRTSLRRLHVLKRDVEPKVNRADISAIANDLPPKTEYFITVPLTEIQEKAYNLYVKFLLGIHNPQKPTKNTNLWAWLGVLSLLCNHPALFAAKMRERLNQQHPESQELDQVSSNDEDNESSDAPSPGDSEPHDLPSDVTVTADVVGTSVASSALALFREFENDGTLWRPEMSNRALIVEQIIKDSMKVGDKVLIFSHSIPTLNYLQDMLNSNGCKHARIDGGTDMAIRQESTRNFNKSDSTYNAFLISTMAGGLGLNLQGANRVIIYDFSFNPSWEEQAIARAYRIGQPREVFVYRFRSGGTFEEKIYNKAVFKTQLFDRVVDQKNYKRHAQKSTASDYLFKAKKVRQVDFDEECLGRDPDVLDPIIKRVDCIRNIELTETFRREDDEKLNDEDLKVANLEYENEVLRRNDPAEYQRRKAQRQAEMLRQQAPVMSPQLYFPPSSTAPLFPRQALAANTTHQASTQPRPQPPVSQPNYVSRPALFPIDTPAVVQLSAELAQTIPEALLPRPPLQPLNGLRPSYDDYTYDRSDFPEPFRAASVGAVHASQYDGSRDHPIDVAQSDSDQGKKGGPTMKDNCKAQ